MKSLLLVLLFPLSSFALQNVEAPKLLRTLKCTATIKKYVDDQPTGLAKEITFTIEDYKTNFTWDGGNTDSSYDSKVVFKSLPSESAATLYGNVTANNTGVDVNTGRDSGPIEHRPLAGLAVYGLTTKAVDPNSEQELPREVARLFLQSKVGQASASKRTYKLALSYWDGTDEYNTKSSYGSEAASCELVP